MLAEALAALVFAPLLAATVAAVVPARLGRIAVCASVLVLPVLLWPLTQAVQAGGRPAVALAGLVPPLGIGLQLDGLSLLLLWLVAAVMLAATTHAWTSIAAGRAARRFWPLWAGLLTGLNVMLLSADLFNLYVGLELMTLAAVALVAYSGTANALRAAMRYLLLAMLASLVYLLGVALVYAATGTLDIAQAGARLPEGPLRGAALGLMIAGLLLKSAMFPLHGWLPFAHASAPGPVSAVLSALVVKASLYLVYRLWFDMLPGLPPAPAGLLMGLLGAGAVLVGSLLALRQQSLKRIVAYSTVAQLGYLMLVFAMPVAAAWQGAVYQMLSHGLAKAAMFLAAANLMRGLGDDGLERLPGVDARLPLSVFAFGLAGVSLIGLPPSGGFLAKWQLMVAAASRGEWAWIALLLVGSLLAAAYLFRVLGRIFSRPGYVPGVACEGEGRPVARSAELAALLLALMAIAAGFASAPLLELLGLPALLLPGSAE